MGKYFADQYSLLHFSVGVIFYFWNVPFFISLLIHFIFEIVENTQWGMQIINNYFVGKTMLSWPGGKNEPDTLMNITGDNVFFILGWVVSRMVDVLGAAYGFYVPHLQ